MNTQTTMEIERNDEEITVIITGNFIAGSPGVHTLSNGDPGYPADPAEMDDVKSFHGKTEIELTEDETEKAIEKLFESAAADYQDSKDWEAESRAEARMERESEAYWEAESERNR